MSIFRLTTDLFLLPESQYGGKILYAPCLGVVFQANQEFINLMTNLSSLDSTTLTTEEKSTLQYLVDKGVLNGPETFEITDNRTIPEKLTLFPTNKCNLKCIYCYAANYQRTAKSMDQEIAKHAINNHMRLLKDNVMTIFYLELHGGGEPFADFELVKEIVNYTEKQCEKEKLELRVTASTNGVLTREKMQWIVNHVFDLCVSFEVLPEIQNFHRPFPNGDPSFQFVDKALRYFDKQGFQYSIRVTVSRHNVILLKETIDFVSYNYTPKTVVFEPVNKCTGCHDSQNLTCHLNEFTEKYLEAEEYAESKSIRILYSGGNTDCLSPYFCYVGTPDFAVTPDGYLTNCWEVTDKSHPLADIFIFGKIGNDGEVILDHEKQKFLNTLKVNNFSNCQNCFAKWHCSGGCAARLGNRNLTGARNEQWCNTTRDLMTRKLMRKLNIENQFIHNQ